MLWHGDKDVAAVSCATQRTRIERQLCLFGAVLNMHGVRLDVKDFRDSVDVALAVIIDGDFITDLKFIDIIKWRLSQGLSRGQTHDKAMC